MPNNSVTIEPSAKPSTPEITDRIYTGSGRGANPLHKIGSAKQFKMKSTGKVANQAKFPMAKSGPRKKG